MTFGTGLRARPPEIEIVTSEPFFTCVPAPGRCAKTMPAGRELGAVFGMTLNPLSVSCRAAALDFIPTTSGTVRFSLPRERKNQRSNPATTSRSSRASQTHQCRSGGGATGSVTSSSAATADDGMSRRIASSTRAARCRPPARSIQSTHCACRSGGMASKRSRASGAPSSAAAKSSGRSWRTAICAVLP